MKSASQRPHISEPSTCFADVRVNSYILGKGSPRLTVQTGLYIGITEQRGLPERRQVDEGGGEAISEDEFLPWISKYLGNRNRTWRCASPLRDRVRAAQQSFTRTGGIRGKEVILFLGPSINPATEAWQVFQTWDVQRKHRRRRGRGPPPQHEAWKRIKELQRCAAWPLDIEVELPRFRTRGHGIPAQARLEAFDWCVSGLDATLPMLVLDTNDLDEFMAGTGAYDHPDGPPESSHPRSPTRTTVCQNVVEAARAARTHSLTGLGHPTSRCPSTERISCGAFTFLNMK